MKAFVLDRYGKKEKLRAAEVPEPELRDDDVLIQVHAAAVNLLDIKLRNGEFKLILPYRLPLVLGHDVAGIVAMTTALRINLITPSLNTGAAVLGDSYTAIERILTGTGADHLTGNGGANRFDSGAGNDTLFGGAGDDVLSGGAGKDYLTGGTGADQFVFLTNSGNGDAIYDFNSADELLRATLPAGTVSGAPKVRAMEIIDELEPVKRGPYAGVVGYVDFSGNLDTAIAIRTMFIGAHGASLQAGAGIVADSIPEEEDLECFNKTAALMAAIPAARRMTAARNAAAGTQ